MNTANLVWIDPTTRVDGSPLLAAQIASIEILLSTDKGVTFVSEAKVQPGVQKFSETLTNPGDYVFKAVVHTVDGESSAGVTAAVTVPVPVAAPSDVSGFSVTLS